MMKFAAEAAKYMPYAEVIELHHDQKLDAPSGTAVTTLEKIAQNREAFRQGREEEFEKIPELAIGEEVKKEEIEAKQSFTEPPARYTEASLVKTLEEKGIGRPSTYAPTITTILERRYIEKVQKQLIPTDLGKVVNKLLVENFGDVINVEFTAKMEEEFDKVAVGEEKWKKVIKEFYTPFAEIVEKAEKELEHVTLQYEESDVPCEKCGKMMVIKYGRYGKFLACPGYPECQNAKPIIETIDVPCPVCGGTVQIRKTKKRRSYYICEKNLGVGEGCYYISWNKPKVGEKFVPSNEEDIALFERDEKKAKKKKASIANSKTKKTTTKAQAKNIMTAKDRQKNKRALVKARLMIVTILFYNKSLNLSYKFITIIAMNFNLDWFRKI